MQENFIKVINATYKVLGFFPETEPLRNRAKDKVLSILEMFTLVSLQKTEQVGELVKEIEILESYLRLGQYQGWIDHVNFLILKKEYDAIKLQMAQKLISTKSEVPRQIAPLPPAKKQEVTESPLPKEENQEQFSLRQEKILNMLSQKEKLQVADIIKEIPDVTKRTLRRDLDDLLKKGKVIRAGEWNQVFYRLGNLGQRYLS